MISSMRWTSLCLPFLLILSFLAGCSLPGASSQSGSGSASQSTPGALALSPDAFQIAVDVYPAPEQPGLYVMNADESNRTRLRDGAGTPDWSPDGKRIVYSSEGDSKYLHIMKADGSEDRQVTDQMAGQFPAWSPKGDQIAFATIDVNNPQVFVVRLDGTGLRRVSAKGGTSPSWSPDGGRIVYSNPDGAGLTIVRADGTEPKQITAASSWEPSWSPDGRRIAFDSWYGELFVIDVDGRNKKQLRSDKDLLTPDWSKDGQWLLVSGKLGDDEQPQVYAVSVDGGETKRLTEEKIVGHKHAAWNR
ncbi:MAG: hypothetical protein M1358_05290 [Chloroflexi bacterium]|nr:hypothetical protein [Chloroflexota bacterium]